MMNNKKITMKEAVAPASPLAFYAPSHPTPLFSGQAATLQHG